MLRQHHLIRRVLPVFLVTLLFVVAPASAWEFSATCRGEITWGSNNVTFEPTLGSFPAGSAWRNSLESARNAWNNNTPASVFNINFNYVAGNAFTANDGRSSILITNNFGWGMGVLGVELTELNKTNCPIWPFSRPRIDESDILFNPNLDFGLVWDNATNPPLPFGIFDINSTLVAMHELGHGFGLAHENDVLGTMDEFYPDGGPLGNGNQVHPHPDDIGGNLDAYGWTPLTGPFPNDLAASAFRRDGAGTSEEIQTPATLDRGVPRAMQFTLLNRSLNTRNNVRIQFYLSTNDFISTADILLGATTLNLPGLFSGTFTTNITVPITVTPGDYHFGYIVDANFQVAEVNEGNNAVAHADPLAVTNNNIPPTACISINPDFGDAPLAVTANGSCSSDPDGTVVSYSWNMGDGTIRSGQSVSHTYFDPGFYNVTLTVTDNDGATDTETWFVEVFGDCDGFPCEV